ncbi:Hypothetical Protein FCC1311_026682 [Hondaea fermentalgiana]|uniref:Uncharacterized protein n=1 Tax=Hondaea fermentalgiana TaxID=2315210 RepID=A0A2R5G5X4_9STRA|nr:Hypothetical Protein FCC1311_026682 [Hondaea fermentalgiana]|eukprot:GBG26447.1 Hypothetical Protein FCC1311_026682 [Hondaea fermentalgiana]
MTTPRPEMALAGLQREQQDLNTRLYGGLSKGGPTCGSDSCGDNDHAHDGCCGHGGTGNPYIDEADGFVDPGLAQCCIKELEDNRKWNELNESLRRVDPVAKAEREAREVVVLAAPPAKTQSVHDWVASAPCTHDHDAGSQSTPTAQDAEEDDDSDAEIDALLAEWEDDDDVLQQLAQQNSDRPASNLLQARLLLITDYESAEGDNRYTSDMLAQSAHDALLRIVQTQNAFAAARTPGALLSQDHPLRAAAASLNGGRLRDDEDLPCVLAISSANHRPMALLPRKKIAQDPGAIESLAQWLLHTLTAENERARHHGAGTNDDDEDEAFCDRPGCGRRFPHEHVKRDAKDGMSDYVSF